jgi:hypothetical protein
MSKVYFSLLTSIIWRTSEFFHPTSISYGTSWRKILVKLPGGNRFRFKD